MPKKYAIHGVPHKLMCIILMYSGINGHSFIHYSKRIKRHKFNFVNNKISFVNSPTRLLVDLIPYTYN